MWRMCGRVWCIIYARLADAIRSVSCMHADGRRCIDCSSTSDSDGLEGEEKEEAPFTTFGMWLTRTSYFGILYELLVIIFPLNLTVSFRDMRVHFMPNPSLTTSMCRYVHTQLPRGICASTALAHGSQLSTSFSNLISS